MKIKVCGIADNRNLDEVANTKPDFMGFIFYPHSKRYAKNIDPNKVIDLPNLGIDTVGVFVNEPLNVIAEKCKEFGFTHIQLHGNESADFCYSVQKMGVKVIKAFLIGTEINSIVVDYQQYTDVADYFLFDTKGEKVGGNGIKFDANLLSNIDVPKPFFLAGGIDPDYHLPKLKNLVALDVNSRFEIEPGIKDAKLLSTFIHRIKYEQD